MKAIEEFFSIESEYATKHKLNTCNKEVPKEYLEQIESGCSLEQLEKMMKQFDVFKYRTQLTIHGLFPDLSTNRIGQYVNLIQNKNRSIGVRYNAIDYDKKTRLFNMLTAITDWRVISNSTEYMIVKMEGLPRNWNENREQVLAIVEKYKVEAGKIDKSLFIGNINCFISKGIFRDYMVLSADIKCFYEKNFEKLFETLSGIPYEEGKRKYDETIAKKKREKEIADAKYEEEEKQRQMKREQMAASRDERRKQFIANNPLPSGFTYTDNYVPNKGDIIARCYERYDYTFEWRVMMISKSFGRVLATPCDLSGKKTGKGHELTKASYKNLYVKPNK